LLLCLDLKRRQADQAAIGLRLSKKVDIPYFTECLNALLGFAHPLPALASGDAAPVYEFHQGLFPRRSGPEAIIAKALKVTLLF
jgi:hypothetical protein